MAAMLADKEQALAFLRCHVLVNAPKFARSVNEHGGFASLCLSVHRGRMSAACTRMDEHGNTHTNRFSVLAA
jgi:hypothetical protein